MTPPTTDAELIAKLELMANDIAEIKRTGQETKNLITGNGTPENGMLFRLKRNEERTESLEDESKRARQLVWRAAAVLLLGLLGGGKALDYALPTRGGGSSEELATKLIEALMDDRMVGPAAPEDG